MIIIIIIMIMMILRTTNQVSQQRTEQGANDLRSRSSCSIMLIKIMLIEGEHGDDDGVEDDFQLLVMTSRLW